MDDDVPGFDPVAARISGFHIAAAQHKREKRFRVHVAAEQFAALVPHPA
jgi:hypothetical protein